MPTFRQSKYWYYAVGFPLIIGAAIVIGVAQDCSSLPDAEQQYRVHSDRGFDESIKTGMGYINRAAGCTILVDGTADDYDIRFIEMVGTPCSVDAMHEGIKTGHAGNSYRCPGTDKWDIDIEKPGDIHSMVFIGMHEMMHTLEFGDSDSDDINGIMGSNYKPNGRIWPNDAETKQLKTLCD